MKDEMIITPFGIYDPKITEWTWDIPEDMTAEIRDGKIVVAKKKESEDERIRAYVILVVKDWWRKIAEVTDDGKWPTEEEMLACLEKQKENPKTADSIQSNCVLDAIWASSILTNAIVALADSVDFNRSEPLIFSKEIDDLKKLREEIEKQKEQEPMMRDGEIEDNKRDIVAAIRKYYPADYAEYLTSFLKGLSPEDNSDDEYGQEMLGIAYKLMYEHIPENLRTQEFWDSLKFMREYTGKVAIIQPYENPAEWSKEDDYRIRWIISLLTTMREKGIDDRFGDSVPDDIPDMLAWLKSLRPQPKLEDWTDEDETLLSDALGYVTMVEELKKRGELKNFHTSCSGVELRSWIRSLKSRPRKQPHWKPSEEQN